MPLSSPRIPNLKIHVEVPVFLLFYAFTLSGSIKANLIIFRTCYVSLGYNETECALLGSNDENSDTEHLEKLVQPYAAVISMVQSVIESSVTVIICFFVGPWSDRFGRRPLIIIPMIGFVVTFILLALFAALENLSPWYSVVTSIPVMLTGGNSSFSTGVLCYISDVTTHESRGVRMGWFEAIIVLGVLLANITSSYLLAITSYSLVFLTSAASCLVALILSVFFIPESLRNIETQNRFKELFKISNVKEMMKTTVKRRPKYDRFTIFCCIILLTLFMVLLNGDGAVVFLYLREKFHWSLKKYTLYSAAHNVLWLSGTFVGVYGMHKWLKIPETLMIWVALMSLFAGSLLQALAKQDVGIYIAAASRSLGAALSPMARSLLSKVVPNEETGRIFAFITTSEGLFGITGSPIFTAIYNATLQTDPSIFSYVSAGIHFLQILMAIAMIVLRSRKDDVVYEELAVNEENEDRDVGICT